jgi:hypothetical protein
MGMTSGSIGGPELAAGGVVEAGARATPDVDVDAEAAGTRGTEALADAVATTTEELASGGGTSARGCSSWACP